MNSDIESNGRRQQNTKPLSKIDWDGYSKSGNKAASVWLFFLFVLLGISIQQASLSAVVAQHAAAQSAAEDRSFDSPDLIASSSGALSSRRNMEELKEETVDKLVPSSESVQMESKRNITEGAESIDEPLTPA